MNCKDCNNLKCDIHGANNDLNIICPNFRKKPRYEPMKLVKGSLAYREITKKCIKCNLTNRYIYERTGICEECTKKENRKKKKNAKNIQ